MKAFMWSPKMSVDEVKNGAYWERNMLAAYLVLVCNAFDESFGEYPRSGWFPHQGEGFEGWSRVISITFSEEGKVTFHVPDDFDLGDIPQIEPNWDGTSTIEKWKFMGGEMGMEVTK